MLSTSGQPRLKIEENFFVVHGEPEDLECPPSGRLLQCSYPGGDRIRVEFFEVDSENALGARYPGVRSAKWGLEMPITAVEVTMRVGGTEIGFGTSGTSLPRGGFAAANFSGRTRTGFVIRSRRM
jgi:hypothetical protein